jgi:hypothetical protein
VTDHAAVKFQHQTLLPQGGAGNLGSLVSEGPPSKTSPCIYSHDSRHSDLYHSKIKRQLRRVQFKIRSDNYSVDSFRSILAWSPCDAQAQESTHPSMKGPPEVLQKKGTVPCRSINASMPNLAVQIQYRQDAMVIMIYISTFRLSKVSPVPAASLCAVSAFTSPCPLSYSPFLRERN